jgi:hypothetical protein
MHGPSLTFQGMPQNQYFLLRGFILWRGKQAEHLAKRKELWAMRDLSGNSVPSKKPQHERQFAADTAEATGVSKRMVNKTTARADQITQGAVTCVLPLVSGDQYFLNDRLRRCQ